MVRCGPIAVVALLLSTGSTRADDRAAIEFFEEEVRPILVAHCHQCHGPEKQESDLRLDSAAAALKGGVYGPAVVPGKSDESMLIYATSYQNEDLRMPPRGPLPAEQIAMLRRWVEMGARWPEELGASQAKPFDLSERRASHWAWQPVRRPPLPNVSDSTWPRNDVDRFILSRLDERGLKPALDADRRTLIRRAYLDLIGLPPTPDEVADFLADGSPRAFERVVDRLLASPHFGERWARHWFDLVRYAETYGHEGDYSIPHAWQYRDYVIRALNADVPYHEFVKEHIAGDLTNPPRLHPTEGFNESIIATGFWFMYEQTHAPTDIRQHEADRVDNQIDVMTKAFLAITVGCARCHDHKFDAISTRDYYGLAGFLKSSREQIALLDKHGRIEATANRLSEFRAAGTRLLNEAIPKPTESAAREFARFLLATWEVEGGRPAAEVATTHGLKLDLLNAWLAAVRSIETQHASHPLYAWTQLKGQPEYRAADLFRVAKGIRKAVAARAQYDGQHWLIKRGCNSDFADWFTSGWAFPARDAENSAWDASSDAPAVTVPGAFNSGAVGKHLQGAARSPTFIIPGQQLHIRAKGRGAQIRLIVDNYTLNDQSSLLFDGLIAKVDSDDRFNWITMRGDLGKYIGERAYLSLEDEGNGALAVDEIVFTDDPPPADPPSTLLLDELERGNINCIESLAEAYGRVWLEALAQWHGGELEFAHAQLLNWAIHQGLVDTSPIAAKLIELRAKMERANESLPTPMKVLAIADGSGQDERVYLRGKHQNLGDVAPRRFLEAVSGPNQPPVGSGSGRLELAQRITHPGNPLFARTAANRIWHHLFGRGIVPTVDNLGVQGEPPSHPELLDWLANEFIRQAWSQKKLIRMLMLSRTYQISSRPADAASEELDPANLQYHRANVRRLEGEAIRDSLLAVSGRLDRTMFGPSVPAYVNPYAESRFQPKMSGPLDGDGRRSVYLQVRRNYLPPMLLAFDAPTPFTSIGRRNVSNVPAQALTMLNDPLVVDLAQTWAQRVKRELADQSPRQRIEHMYESALCRLPTDAELRAAEEFIERQGELLGVPAADRNDDLRTWSDLAHVLFNHKEFILRN